MKRLLSSALLLALAGLARAEAPAQADPQSAVESSAKVGDARRTAKERHKAKRGGATTTPPAKVPDKTSDPKGDKPCQPVKPCPID